MGRGGRGGQRERERKRERKRADILLSRRVICNERLLRNVFIP